MVRSVKMTVQMGGGGLCILSDFKELSFFGPCGPCFMKTNLGGIPYTTHGAQISHPLIFYFCYFLFLFLFYVRLG